MPNVAAGRVDKRAAFRGGSLGQWRQFQMWPRSNTDNFPAAADLFAQGFSIRKQTVTTACTSLSIVLVSYMP